MIGFFKAMVWRDLILLVRRPLTCCLPTLFFLSVVIIFAMTIASKTADKTAPGIIWSAVLMASLLSQETLFRHDYDSGFMEQVLVSAQPLPLFVLAKVLTNWFITGLPLIASVPMAALLLNVSTELMMLLLLVLPLATLVLSVLSSLSAALTLADKSNVVLGVLLIFPLLVPVILFTTLTTTLATMGLSPLPPLLLLASLAILIMTFLPLAVASILRAMGGG